MINHRKKNGHNLLIYNKRYLNCNKHLIDYVSYCSSCNVNLCENCERVHGDHKNKIIFYKKEINNKKFDEIEKELKDNILTMNKYKNQLNDINYLFTKYIDDLKKDTDYYNAFYNKLLIILDNKNNYENMKNVLSFKNLKIKKEINNFVNENNKNKMKLLINNFKNEFPIVYNIDENDKEIKLFGDKFVKNKKDICYLIIENKKMNLCGYYHLENEIKSNYLKVILGVKNPLINKITNMSEMFSKCGALSNYTDFSKWNTGNVINMSDMFSYCDYLPDISNLDTSNVTDMSYMFSYCDSLISLPDISKWNTSKVNNMSNMFSFCKSLLSLPDISNWNTNHLFDMSYMFYSCISLQSLPDISKWNVGNVINMNDLFSLCKSLLFLPDISKWNTYKAMNMGNLFSQCSKLISLPDISKWNTSKVTNMNSMFCLCSSLKSFPDISKWDISNVNNLSFMFSDCKSISFLPDISDWNTQHANNMSYMFSNCELLSSLPNITKWNINKDTDLTSIFSYCLSIKEFPDVLGLRESGFLKRNWSRGAVLVLHSLSR